MYCAADRIDGTRCGRRMYGPGTITSNSASYTCRTGNVLPAGHPEHCTGNSISATWLHTMIGHIVDAIAANPAWQDALRRAYRQAYAATDSDGTDRGQEIEHLQTRMAELRDEHSHAKSAARRAQVARDIDQLDSRIAQLEAQRPAPTPAAGDVALDLTSRWQTMTQSQRRAVLTDLIERIDIAASARPRRPGFDPTRVTVHLRHAGPLHITEPVDVIEPRTCPDCGQSFTKPAALGVHRRHKHGIVGGFSKITPGQRTIYTCPEEGCGRQTTSAGGLKRHVTTQHGRRHTLLCSRGCAKVFATTQDLATHMRQAHRTGADTTPAVCETCGRTCHGEAGLRIHHGRAHRPEA